MTGRWMARSEDDRSVSGLPRIGARVRSTIDPTMTGAIAGYSVVHRADAADWRDGLGQLVALVELDGRGRYLGGRYLEGGTVTTSMLPCDLSSIELAEVGGDEG